MTASASGLDPHISQAAAEDQIVRVAQARGVSPDQIRGLIGSNTTGPDFGILGESGVNVLTLNVALDEHFPKKGRNEGNERSYPQIPFTLTES